MSKLFKSAISMKGSFEIMFELGLNLIDFLKYKRQEQIFPEKTATLTLPFLFLKWNRNVLEYFTHFLLCLFLLHTLRSPALN